MPDAAPDAREQEAIHLMRSSALPQAEALVKDILSDYPDNPHLLTTLGSLAAQQDRYAEAILLLERAVELMPEEATFA